MIVIVSCISLIARDQQQLKSLRSLRTLRALRPLRMISRRPQLKLVVNSLFAAIPNVLNVLIVCILFLLIFAIFCTNYFKGQLMACTMTVGSDPDINGPFPLCMPIVGGNITTFGTNYSTLENLEKHQRKLMTYPVIWDQLLPVQQQCVFGGHSYAPTGGGGKSSKHLTSRVICEHLGYSWDRAVHQNFNNVAYSIGALFELSTTEGWVDVMYAAVDSRGIDMVRCFCLVVFFCSSSVLWSSFFLFFWI